MNVIRSHMCREEAPAPMHANLAQSSEHRRSAVLIETIGRLVHVLSHYSDPFRTGFRQSGSGHIVATIH